MEGGGVMDRMGGLAEGKRNRFLGVFRPLDCNEEPGLLLGRIDNLGRVPAMFVCTQVIARPTFLVHHTSVTDTNKVATRMILKMGNSGRGTRRHSRRGGLRLQ